MTFARAVPIGLFVVAASIHCAEGNPHTSAQFADHFMPTGRSVSVLGVYKDGRMSSSHWSALSTRLATALGGADCENGFDTLTSSNPVVADAIAQYAKAEGPDDTLLGKLAPAASGDLILVIGIAGHMPTAPAHQPAGTSPSASSRATPSRPVGGRGMHRGGYAQMGNTPRSETTQESDTLDLSASFYSVAQQGFVALIELKYGGTDITEAIDQFAMLLSQKMPQMRCVGWAWEDKLKALELGVSAPSASTRNP